MKSVWSEKSDFPSFPVLERDINIEVLIVGGGIVGLLCALKLKEAGIDCILVESEKICSGITQNTTAKITVQHGLIYSKLIKQRGKDVARLYLEANENALAEYKRLCDNIDCDFTERDSYVYSQTGNVQIKEEAEALRSLGKDAQLCLPEDLPIKIAEAVCLRGQGQFDPLKFLSEISKGLPIYENTKFVEIRNNTAITNHGAIKFKKVIIATHFPVINKHGGYFLKLYQHRSYVMALEGAPLCRGMYVEDNIDGMSFRSFGELLLIGGGGHRTGKSGGGYSELEAFANKYYPMAKIKAKWATQDCMSLDGVPYIGRYSRETPEMFVATGFNKWGMTSSMVSAEILSDAVQGRESKYNAVYSPSRSILTPQLGKNALESLLGIIKPTMPRCPHMGCALKYNPYEHSWDCPCHGSRFTEEGNLIDNPATDDKKSISKYKEKR